MNYRANFFKDIHSVIIMLKIQDVKMILSRSPIEFHRIKEINPTMRKARRQSKIHIIIAFHNKEI
jgi:hypothetical protein